MSLENLGGMDVVVTSASKKEETLRKATAAIFVITSEDIQRSGFQHLPDLLIMVPGVQVCHQSADEWAISARGFNAQYNNKMLVLVDGRSVYDPIYGGVNWNEQDIPLEDIDRIEVIRGPGGTLWGSNAVNGIVNIITKDSKVTQGFHFSRSEGDNVYSGTDPHQLNSHEYIRYGGKLSDDWYYRVSFQENHQDPFANPKDDIYEAALSAIWNDAWHDYRAGFRVDGHPGRDHWTFEGEGQKGDFNYARLTTNVTPFFDPANFTSGNDLNTNIDQNAHLLGRWSRDFEDDSQIQALAYYDFRNLTTTNDSRATNVGQADVEFQHRFHLAGWNEITWGGSFRDVADQFLNPINTYFDPQDQRLDIYGGFLQDRLTLAESELYLTAGSKVENNNYTGVEWQPSGRLLFTPDDRNSIWAAVSRAVRLPIQVGEVADIYLGGVPANQYGPGIPTVNSYAAFVPNPQLASETLVSYELGYRTNPTKETSLDAAAFYNHYTGLFSFQYVTGQSASPAGGIIDGTNLFAVQAQNTGTGDIYGVELAGKWTPLKSLKVNLTYTYQDYDQSMIASSNIETGAPPPHSMFNAWLNFDPFPDWELNGETYFTGQTFLYDPRDKIEPTSAFWVFNLGATWKPDTHTRLSLWAMDLEGAHMETLESAFISPAQVVPSFYGQVSVEY